MHIIEVNTSTWYAPKIVVKVSREAKPSGGGVGGRVGGREYRQPTEFRGDEDHKCLMLGEAAIRQQQGVLRSCT